MPPTSCQPAPALLILFLLAACSAGPDPTRAIAIPTPPPIQTSEAALSTPTPSTTPPTTVTPWPSATPAPARFVDELGNVMLYVPAGEFTMGSETGFPDEMPVHTVYVDAFYIDRVETTNRQYQDCVEAGACRPPRRTDCCTEDPNYYVRWPEYFGNPEFDDYPVIFVSWFDARDYCAWRGARLATEAEWEKAARGPDGRTYPWGDEEPIPDLLNFTWPESAFAQRPLYRTAPVGSYPAGASPYGVLDMAGNVYEWVYDIYERDYYKYSPYENPTGPEEGTFRVTRGGSFYNQAFRNRSSNRNNAYIPADSFHFDGGIRCALDAE